MSTNCISHQNITAFGVLHYNLESTVSLKQFLQNNTFDAIAVELPEALEESILASCARLPDISVIKYGPEENKQVILTEPIDPFCEAIRMALETGKEAFCIDALCNRYPKDPPLPDPCSISYIGIDAYHKALKENGIFKEKKEDLKRENHMAFRLKELSLQFDNILFLSGMSHLERVMNKFKNQNFEASSYETPTQELVTLEELSAREVLANCGYITEQYEIFRNKEYFPKVFPEELERRNLLCSLYKKAALSYEEKTGNSFKNYHLKNLMKFCRNYALISQNLSLDLFQTLSAAKACVDSNYAYEVWELATRYSHLKNIDSLSEESFSIKDFWPGEKRLSFQLKNKSSKQSLHSRLDKSKEKHLFQPPSPYSICSHTPEDKIIEDFGLHLRKKSSRSYAEKHSKSLPFSTSLEDGIDVKETLRHWYEKKLYVKVQYKKSISTGSVVVIFEEDKEDDKYHWKTSWLGEHDQESDMAFYATNMQDKIVGPGISRCEYGGFMMSYPPRRLYNPRQDLDYSSVSLKSEVLL
ncbi:hypothetical protein AB751O23_AA_00010, partial [Chlamydiales bacterium SCGC AB-751-O23]